jgi:hypothetical protein
MVYWCSETKTKRGTTLAKEVKMDYLIVCPDYLDEAAESLREFRELRGHSVSIVRLSEIAADPTAEQIDDWIKTLYAANPSLSFITLLGEVSILPSFSVTMETSSGPVELFSDLRYSVTSGDLEADYRPSLFVGRIPVSTVAGFETYKNKMVAFEANYRTCNTIVFFGNTTELDAYAIPDDVNLAESLGYDTIVLVLPTEPDLYETLNDNAVAMVFYYGHGSYSLNPPMNLDNLDTWENTNFPVLFFSGGCDFNDNNNSSGLQPIGHVALLSDIGSAASIGCVKKGGYGYSYRLVDEFLALSVTSDTIGDLFVSALRALYDFNIDEGREVGFDSYNYFTTQKFNLVGDPALRIGLPVLTNVDVIPILDHSGSMSGYTSSSSVDRKIDVLRYAAHHFLDILDSDSGHQLGIVKFSTTASTVMSLQSFTDASRGLAHDEVDDISPTNLTSIGDGLSHAIDEFTSSGDPTHRRFALLITDGKENTAPMIDSIFDDIVSESITVLSLGLGYGSGIDQTKLASLSDATGGYYRVTDDDLDDQAQMLDVGRGNLPQQMPTCSP